VQALLVGEPDPDDGEHHDSRNPPLSVPVDRRRLLQGGLAAMAAAAFAPRGLAGCATLSTRRPTLGFAAVAKHRDDRVTVPPGYTATVLYATGDALDPAVGDWRNDGTAAAFDRRAGDHHDALAYFGIGADGRHDAQANDRALLAVNHENVYGTVMFLHPRGPTRDADGRRPAAEVRKEIDAHGVSIVEIRRGADGRFARQAASPFHRRITAATPVDLHGPLRGSPLARTAYSPDGSRARGTLSNCAGHRTPWGTYLTCEEGWAYYFARSAADDAARPPLEVKGLRRAGLREGRYDTFRWSTAGDADEFVRWDASVRAAEPTGDFRHEPNTFGWPVEIDPFAPSTAPRKRTAMGRFAHEGATPSRPVAGRPLAFYMGDDARGEYLYKFVSAAAWDPADAHGGLAAGDKYLDRGRLYAARFDADGRGRWLPLDLANPAVRATGLGRLDEVVVHTRLAADAAGATPLDRPEWTAVNPANGEVYVTCTENPDRGNTGRSSNDQPNPPLDAANPRRWLDRRDGRHQRGNVNGHVLRLREQDDDAAAEGFEWDVYLFGAQARADAGLDDVHYQQNVNLSGLTDANDLSRPDGCWFSPTTGILWIETDDQPYTDVTNCMLLAAVPGRVGDGEWMTVDNEGAGSPDPKVTANVPVRTRAGQRMTEATLRRFLVAPRGAEVTGLTESPDGRALFVNIQHPGENTPATAIGEPSKYESHWPGNGGGLSSPYGPGGALARPRSATVMITKDDGGPIGA
jgi:secreted PhoX family phosphatase